MKKTVSILAVIATLLTVISLFGVTVNASAPSFSAGNITETENGKTIASDSFSVFVSSRASAWGGKSDLRFILCANLELISAYKDSELYLDIAFLNAEGTPVKSLKRDVFDDLLLYAKATAAGTVYTAAEGSVLFGIVISEAPNHAWSKVQVSLVSDTTIAQGSADVANVATYEGYDLAVSDLGGNTRVDTIDVHYGKLALDFALGGPYTDIIPTEIPDATNWSNPKYQWVLRVNGEEMIPAKLSVWHFGDWGQLRAELGDLSDFTFVDNKATFYIELKIVDVATGKIAYYINFIDKMGAITYEKTPSVADPDMPADVTPVIGIDLVSGPAGYADTEGPERACNGLMTDKLCTVNTEPLIFKLSEKTALKGLAIVNSYNEPDPERTLLDFTVYVSDDGENWGDPVLVSTSEGKVFSTYAGNLCENYYAFDEICEATYVKIVTAHPAGVAYQLAEIVLYQ
ncbi:MAG: hypothetical protein IJW46_06930 [Clostridia bacterium]|nr:hypothetical protein [Clostridia bacterium]